MKAPKKAIKKAETDADKKRAQNAARQRNFKERQKEKLRLLEETTENPKELALESRVLILERRLAALERQMKKPSKP